MVSDFRYVLFGDEYVLGIIKFVESCVGDGVGFVDVVVDVDVGDEVVVVGVCYGVFIDSSVEILRLIIIVEDVEIEGLDFVIFVDVYFLLVEEGMVLV